MVPASIVLVFLALLMAGYGYFCVEKNESPVEVISHAGGVGLLLLLTAGLVALFCRRCLAGRALNLAGGRGGREDAQEKTYHLLFESMNEGCAYCRMLFDERGGACDWIYLSVNSMFGKLTGLQGVVGKRVSEVIPGIREKDPELLAAYARVSQTGKPEKLETFVESLQQWFSISIFSHRKDFFVAVFDVITERKRTEEALVESRNKLEAALGSMTDAVFISDASGQFIDANDAFAAFHRFKNKSECVMSFAEYSNFLEVFLPDGRAVPLDMWPVPRALRGETATNAEYSLRRKDTGEAWVGSYSYAPIRDKTGGIVGSVVVGRDISDQKAAEARIARLTQIFAALSQSNQAIVRSSNPEELLPTICRVAVEFGGMKMACISVVDEVTGKVRKVAAFGSGTEYLDDVEDLLDAGNPLGRGPTGTAIREGRPVWCQDFRNDPSIEPWHKQGEAFGWQSSAAIPLSLEGKTIGALTLYSDTLDAFDEDARNLLIEMADDISFGWESFIRQEARAQAEEELQNLRTAVEQSANTVVITDAVGRIEYVNPAFEKSTGYTAAEALGNNPRILKSGAQDAAFYGDLWASITSGKIWRGEFHNRRKDGSLYWEFATISPVQNDRGETVHFIAVKEDITARKSMEAKILDALNLAEAGNRAKSEFLAIMSHELRTPLNGVLGFAELLSDTTLDDEQKDYIRTIRTSGEHLLQVVNDILDFSSIEKGTMRFECAPVLVADLVESACLPNRKTAADKGLEFRCEMDPRVPVQITGDSRRICQILINLIANAIKFTESGSVVLRVAPAPGAERLRLDFSVQDTGIGIPPETINNLFKPFTQADSKMSRRFEGTGLGLAISRRLAEGMGGGITVTSTPGHGSTFTCRLPVDAADLLQSEDGTALCADKSRGESTPPFSGSPVLIVEDDPDNALLAMKMIESLGYRAEYVVNGQEALDAFRSGSYSAILMDMQMPVMDGLSATRRIRELEISRRTRVPVIALTANALPIHKEICVAAGMDDYLSKPFTKAQLAETLARCLTAG